MGREGWGKGGKNKGRKKEREKTCPNTGFLKVAECNGSLMYKILTMSPILFNLRKIKYSNLVASR